MSEADAIIGEWKAPPTGSVTTLPTVPNAAVAASMPGPSPATTVCSGALKLAIQTRAFSSTSGASALATASGAAPITATIVPGSASAAASIAAPRAVTSRVAASRSRIPAAVERGVLAQAVTGGGRDASRALVVFGEERVDHDLEREGRDLRPVGARQRVVVRAQQQLLDVVTRDVGRREPRATMHRPPATVHPCPTSASPGPRRATRRDPPSTVMEQPRGERVGFDVEPADDAGEQPALDRAADDGHLDGEVAGKVAHAPAGVVGFEHDRRVAVQATGFGFGLDRQCASPRLRIQLDGLHEREVAPREQATGEGIEIADVLVAQT